MQMARFCQHRTIYSYGDDLSFYDFGASSTSDYYKVGKLTADGTQEYYVRIIGQEGKTTTGQILISIWYQLLHNVA